MSKYILKHDEPNCIACQACEVHCKTNKQLGPGPFPCKIITSDLVEIEAAILKCALSSCLAFIVKIHGV